MKTNNSIFKISHERAREIALQNKTEMNKFWKEHCANISDLLTLILKCHLFIENIIDDILSLCLPQSQKILEKSAFSYKVTLFEALDISPNNVLVKKIRAINKLRNHYAHYLNKSLTRKETNQIIKGLDITSKELTFEEILKALHYIIGYLHALRTIEKLFPFIRSCQRNNSRLKDDKSFIHCKSIIKNAYPEMTEILENLKL